MQTQLMTHPSHTAVVPRHTSSAVQNANGFSVAEAAAWRQVLARDPAADGHFVYAVRSTGIFCRPSCPSRRPAMSRVCFFQTSAAAVAAGFRACLRCRPERTGDTPEARRAAAVVAEAVRFMEASGTDRVDLEALSAATGEARSTLLRAFRRTLGTTPARYARQRRLQYFRASLAPTRTPQGTGVRGDDAVRVTDAIYDAGFGSSSRLYAVSEMALGMTPSTMRAGAAGVHIRYATTETPLGRALVAATERGVCAISFAGTDQELQTELAARFPRATLEPITLTLPASGDALGEAADAGRWLTEATAYVLSQLSEAPMAARFPLDVRATAFQERVWQALRLIPRGETVSYAELARRLGVPAGARAVAGACARNPIALANPCHRVIGGSGALSGYRWGIERKRHLLEMERPGA